MPGKTRQARLACSATECYCTVVSDAARDDRERQERAARLEGLKALLDEWCDEDPTYDREALDELKVALNESRRAAGARLLFPDDE